MPADVAVSPYERPNIAENVARKFISFPVHFCCLTRLTRQADTNFRRPTKVGMTRKQAQALEVVLLAINAARKAGLSDAAIFEAINIPIYPQRVSGGLKPKQSADK